MIPTLILSCTKCVTNIPPVPGLTGGLIGRVPAGKTHQLCFKMKNILTNQSEPKVYVYCLDHLLFYNYTCSIL